jgi:hypothetical protein
MAGFSETSVRASKAILRSFATRYRGMNASTQKLPSTKRSGAPNAELSLNSSTQCSRDNCRQAQGLDNGVGSDDLRFVSAFCARVSWSRALTNLRRIGSTMGHLCGIGPLNEARTTSASLAHIEVGILRKIDVLAVRPKYQPQSPTLSTDGG